MPNSHEQSEELSLSKSAQYLLEECRMVLPGIQALFGFQLVVAFSPGFSEKLTRPDQIVHFVAITLIAVAVAIIMTPAALHRGTGSKKVTATFVNLSARLQFLEHAAAGVWYLSGLLSNRARHYWPPVGIAAGGCGVCDLCGVVVCLSPRAWAAKGNEPEG
jgi:hypothetical protein